MCVDVRPTYSTVQHLQATLGPAYDARQRVKLCSASLSSFSSENDVGHAIDARQRNHLRSTSLFPGSSH